MDGRVAPEIALEIDAGALAPFPELRVAAFTAGGLRRARADLEAPAVAAQARAALAGAFGDAAAVVADERVQGWRAAIRACGLSASRYRSSAEQLGRRFLRDGGLDVPDPLVQVYCAVSAKHLAPIGAYDLERLPGPGVALRPARPDDVFDPIGGDGDSMPLDPGVIVYAAGRDVLCWAFNHRDSARTALRPDTDTALFVGESVYSAQVQAMLDAMDELRDLLARHGCTVGDLAVAAADRPTITVAST